MGHSGYVKHLVCIFMFLGSSALLGEVPSFKEKDNEGLNKLERILELEKQLSVVSASFNSFEKKLAAMDEKIKLLENEVQELKKEKVK